jgi:drug/metabolite transporter (DMT)-like permease
MDKKAIFAVTISVLFWSSAFAGIRDGLKSYQPGHLALLRFLVASGFLIVYALMTRKVRFPKLRDLPAVVIQGILGITIYHVALVYGEKTVTAGTASLIIALSPIFSSLLAFLFLNENLKKIGWMGILISFFGGILIVLGENQGFSLNVGVFLILVAAFSSSVYIVYQKPFFKKYSPLELTCYTIWGGTIFLLYFFPGFFSAINQAAFSHTLSVIYLGLFPAAIGYLTWTYALSKTPVAVVSSFIYLQPALAIFIAWLWLKEIPSLLSLVGGAISLVGVIMVTKWGR